MRCIDNRRGRFTAILLGAALAATSLPAGAQDSETVDEITVTGSRIMRSNEVMPNPVYGLDAQEIQDTGELNIIEVVNKLPQLFSSQNGVQSSFFDTDVNTGLDNAPGLAVLDLRGLGATRTLTLVDGQRHVSGLPGSSAVDVTTIPTALVERVDVLTGGASSIYGADAVTGVVNFVMKRDFEGTEFDAQLGVPGESGGEDFRLSLTHGQNFMDDRLNVAVNLTYTQRQETLYADRDWARNSGIAGAQGNNWRLVFQNADALPPGASLGSAIATTDANGNCTANFAGTDPAILDRACNARPQAIERNLRFGLTSPRGLLSIALADDITAGTPEAAGSFPFFHTEADLGDLAPGTPIMDFNNNGIDDCAESYIGALAVGGCVVVGDDGNLRPFNPGIIDGNINFDAIGSDGSPQAGADTQFLDPEYEQILFNTLINFQMTDSTRLFADLKYVSSEFNDDGGTISFEDTINISQDNPFVPQQLRDLMNEILALNPQFTDTAQYFLSRDPEDIANKGIYERETIRAVVGLAGDFYDDWTWEASLNYGRTEEEARDNALLPDRYFASLDVVTGPDGSPVCRSEVDPNWTLDTFNSGSINGAPGINTFTPGDGSCVPGNPFGFGLFTPEAQAFIAPFRRQDSEITQFVVNATMTGNTGKWFSLPGGPIAFAVGLEHRDEESESIPDAFEQAGFYFNSQTSAIAGDYSVDEAFIEISAPLLADLPLVQELTVDAAYRFSDYDLAVGQTNTYSAGFNWQPVDDIRLRGTFSRAVRAPNIFELFSPQSGTTFNLDIDPCDASAIASLELADPATGAQRRANCAADPLVGAGFTNPLTSNFPGVSGGNPDLLEETSDTQTYGFVLTPRFVDGLVVTVDYWEIEIEDAIQQVSGADVLRGCYDGPALDPTFCSQFRRESDTSSGFFGGLRFLQTGQINFAGLQTSGYDIEAIYGFDLFKGSVVLRANATYLDEYLAFRSALQPDLADDERGEMLLPEWAGNLSASWSNDSWRVAYTAQYTGNQAHRTVEINEAASFDNAFSGVKWQHNLSANFAVSDRLLVRGGIDNVTDEEPFITQPSFPVGFRGRYFFLGMNYTL
ncbi:MAG: TonB-dependent receptor [Pseudomonadota bacterium]